MSITVQKVISAERLQELLLDGIPSPGRERSTYNSPQIKNVKEEVTTDTTNPHLLSLLPQQSQGIRSEERPGLSQLPISQVDVTRRKSVVGFGPGSFWSSVYTTCTGAFGTGALKVVINAHLGA